MGLFKKAERKKAFLKIAITGVSGSGKTYSALQLAQGLGDKIAMIDTENGSGELYSNLCEYDVARWPHRLLRKSTLITSMKQSKQDITC